MNLRRLEGSWSSHEGVRKMKSREGESNNDESTKQPWNESCELNKMNEIIRISNEMKVKMNLA